MVFHMTDSTVILGLVATLISLIGFILYFKNIFAGKTMPHAFSWLIWAILTGIAFVAQVVEGAGPGAWAMGITSVACFAIFILSLLKGKRQFVLFDWISLVAAFVALFLWWFTKEPTLSIILIALTDGVGFLPTFRKAFYYPYEDTAITFAFEGLKYFISLFALEAITISTWLYPASLVLMNWLFVTFLLIRRKQVKATK